MPYAELCARTSFSFLEGASKPHELVRAAAARGVSHLGVVDRDGVYGLVQAHRVAQEVGVHLICGSVVTVGGQPGVVVLVMNREGWTNLCRLLTLARARTPKGRGRVDIAELCAHASGLLCLLRYGWDPEEARALSVAFEGRLGVAWSRQRTSLDGQRERWAHRCARSLGVPMVATNDVLFHAPDRQPLADVLTCVRRRVSLEQAGQALHLNGERYLLEEKEFHERYGDRPEAIRMATVWAKRCTFSLQSLRYQYPREVVPPGRTPMDWLTEKVEEGLKGRYPEEVPQAVRDQVAHELSVIASLDFPSYFLTVYDIVCFARARGILCQGRGSAANSAVCFALGITSVDPAHSALLFERFISKERGEPPDIDVDFEHERREEVIQYIYERYGRDRAAMVCAVITYRGRSSIRDAGKALGLSLEQVGRMSRQLDRWSGSTAASTEDMLREAHVDSESPEIQRTLAIARQMEGFPRHLSIHTGGFVIADRPLVDLVPIEPASMPGRTVVQWDKEDLAALGFVKVDVLALGMLTCIRKTFEQIEAWTGETYTLATVPSEDEAVYDMFCRAETVGVFQIESRAQMSMLPRLQPRCFYDLVIEVALVRPGPIQGGMVHPYLRRRRGLEPVTYAHPALKPILERTLGVPLFQEQVMAMAVAVGGFTAGQADALRRAMSTWKKRGALEEAGRELVRGMIEQGIEPPFAEAVYQQILGFGEYGFPESHAASFARLVYVSGWLKCHHHAAFLASLLNSQPMGFYSVRALLEDGRRHGVEVRPVCVQQSVWDASLETTREGSPGIRLGLRQVRGMGQGAADHLVACRLSGAFEDVPDLAARTQLPRGVLEALSNAGALHGLGLSRRSSHWLVQGLSDKQPLFGRWTPQEPSPCLKEESELESLWEDLKAVGWSVRGHPLEGFRDDLMQRGCVAIGALVSMPSGSMVSVAGLVSSRQRPSTANGVVFMTLEDETGMLNVVIWPTVWDRFRRLARTHSALCVEGKLQREGLALSLVSRSFHPISLQNQAGHEVGQLPISSHDFH